jgi:hypothetical protein
MEQSDTNCKAERAPAYSEDAEQAVLSALLLEPTALRIVRPLIEAEDFFRRSHARIYRSVVALADRGTVADPITLAEELDQQGELTAAGGKEYIGFLVDAVPTAANIEYHARIVVDRAQRRALCAAAETLRQRAVDGALDVPTIVRAQRDAYDTLLGSLEMHALPPARRASAMPPAPPVRWVVDQLWPAGEIGLIVGDGGSFKSSAAVHLAGAIAAGSRAFGRFSVRHAPALIVSAEDSADVVLMRLRAFIAGQKWPLDVLDNVHVLAEPDITLADVRWQSHIMREAKRVAAGFVVLDPLAELVDGDESSNSEMRPFVKYVRRLGSETGAGIAIVHHAGKAGDGKRQLDRIRGASAFASAARTILFFDYKDDGVHVSNLKNSRAPKVDDFVLRHWIDSVPGNRAEWTSARLTIDGGAAPSFSRAERFVLTQVAASPRQLGSGELRRAAVGTGVSAEDVSSAIASLGAAKRIDFVA